ncbi:MAG: SgcJ/EcaC family oxidoreductase [Candidatus Aminicenantaceae bacterium]
MKKRFMVIPLVFLLCLPFGCQKAEEAAEEVMAEQPVMDVAQVRQSIEEANVRFGEAARSGDAAVLASLYTEDARILPPNSEMIQGREGIEAFWGGGFQMGITDIVLTTVDVMGMGDMVCEIGKAQVSIQPEGMDAIEDMAKYLVVWKKDMDGTWKLHVDIWNTSLPAQ